MWSASHDTSRWRAAEWFASLLALVIGLAMVVALVLSRTYPPAAAGVGDPYYPEAGGSGYDALLYSVDVAYEPDTGVLSGATWVSLRTTQPLDVIHLDLLLPVTGVTVGGATTSFTQQGSDVAIMLATVVGLPANRTGAVIDLRVAYSGRPSDLKFGGDSPVYTGGGELLICGEPESASAWFPSNDHPSDPAVYDISVSVPQGVEGISVGSLIGHGVDPSRPGHDVWHWRTDTPAPTYATMLAVGQYDLETVPVVLGGVQTEAVYAVSERNDDPKRALAWLERSQAAVTTLEARLGPYPLTSLGGIVPGVDPWWGGMETLGRPVYLPRLVGQDSVIYHELAHMWVGDTVTLDRWQDIFLNEALASYAEWLASAAAAGTTPQAYFDELYKKSDRINHFWDQKLSDPGQRDLFTRVYDRGPMAVHALRVRMGDEAFFRFFRDWADQTGPHSLAQWRDAAQQASPVDVKPLLAAWLDGTDKVPATPELGFR
jgi:aminopeptidase N